MKAIGDVVRLRRLWWSGDEPKPGDELRTRTGRRYVIRRVLGQTLECVVVPRTAVVTGRLIFWTWAPRRRRSRARAAKV